MSKIKRIACALLVPTLLFSGVSATLVSAAQAAPGSRVYAKVDENETCGIFEIKNISREPLDVDPQELMERFVRGDRSRSQDGNGLGLSIAQQLCLLQGGRLELSIDGDLFKATVYLPKQKKPEGSVTQA